MSIGAAILGWAEGRAGWQRVALRMLTEVDQLTSDHVKALAVLALREQGHAVPFADPGEPALLDETHLGTMNPGRSDVSVLAIEDIKRVNRLAPGQTLRFIPTGATVIYGDNGSGKSGYARILKRTCGARHAGEQLLGDVYSENDPAPAEATLHFWADGAGDSVHWVDSEAAGRALPEVGFFDAQCGLVHVSGENEVLFTPAGLDLISRLATASDQVRDRLRAYGREVEAVSASPALPQGYEGTQAARALSGLSHATNVADLILAHTLSTEEESELERLMQERLADPALVISQSKILEAALSGIRAALVSFSDTLSADAVEARRLQEVEVATTGTAATLACGELFQNEPLPDVGGEVWRALWQAARRYSNETAYPGEGFPVVRDGAVCVLCQQPLGQEGRGRLRRFEEYVQDATAQAHMRACATLAVLDQTLSQAQATMKGVEIHLTTLEGGMTELCSELRKSVQAFGASAEFPAEAAARPLRELSEGLRTQVDAALAQVVSRRVTAEAALDVTANVARETAITELQARVNLVGQADILDKYVADLRTLSSVSRAADTCDTRAISTFSTELALEFVTARLVGAFRDEVVALGLTRLPIGLAGVGSRKGVSRHRVALSGASDTIHVPNVLSEGEQKCVALAGFLAELVMRDDLSGIVFDDPVTSLDHKWRRAVAGRLAQLAVDRQVVIFTHEIVFLMEFLDACKGLGTEVSTITVGRAAKAVGVTREGLPWEGMSTGKRIGKLKESAHKAEAIHRVHGYDIYELAARTIYGRLRETWERAIEELLLNGVVVRFGREIQTQRLKKVLDIDEEDVDVVTKAMAKCSLYMVGHDDAPATKEDVPLPDELKADIAVLESWADDLKKNRKRG